MEVKFVTNDYLIAWNILFTKSITAQLNTLKSRLWTTYKADYNQLFDDKDLIINDYKNFIPDNDCLYNALFEKEDFEIIRNKAEKTKIITMKLWDKNRKKTLNLTDNIIRIKFPNYLCFIINKDFNIFEVRKTNDKNNIVIIGKKYLDENTFLISLLFEIVKKEIEIHEKDDYGIKDAIIEMAVLNEYATTLNEKSCYNNGRASLKDLKRQIYPYWLMYLGIPKEKMGDYMVRDKIAFDVDSFAYEKEFKNMNLEEFIDFIIRNQRYVINNSRSNDIEELL